MIKKFISKNYNLKFFQSLRFFKKSSLYFNDENNFNKNNPENQIDSNLEKTTERDFNQNYNKSDILYTKEEIEKEPIHPSKNRYLNFKNPALNAFNITDNDKSSFFLFPGQGVQYVGMGKKLFKNEKIKDMFKLASKILGFDLTNTCLNGPDAKLNQTIYSQPAIFVCSLAALENFKFDYPGVVENCIGTAGYSLGELTALVFSGALSFEDGLRLVKIRSEEMQKACEATTSGLMTVILGTDGRISEACQAASEYCELQGIDPSYIDCSVSSYLFPHCKVIGGHNLALNFIENNAKVFGIKRCKRIPVSGAFHTRLMISARFKFEFALKKASLKAPKIPVYCNFDGKPYLDEKEIIHKLPKQIHYPVKWEQTMQIAFTRELNETHPWIFECGPGKNLITILKNVNARAYLKAKHIDV